MDFQDQTISIIVPIYNVELYLERMMEAMQLTGADICESEDRGNRPAMQNFTPGVCWCRREQ